MEYTEERKTLLPILAKMDAIDILIAICQAKTGENTPQGLVKDEVVERARNALFTYIEALEKHKHN